jgi:hemerythrin-like domain-containing protein
MKCTDLLMQDHTLLRRALDVLEAMVHKLECSERIEIADAVTVIRFVKIFGIQYHQIMEESVVFPALLRDAAQDNSVRHMLFEHTEQQELISAVEEGLQLRKGIQFVRNAHGLIALMRSHLEREDSLLRSLGETWLAKDEDDVILSALTQRRMQADNAGLIPALESKYMPKQFTVSLNAQRPLSRAQGSAAH